MAKRSTRTAGSARSALVISDPRAARQFGSQGTVLLWRDAVGDAPRRGLLCVPKTCSHDDCFAVHVWLGEVDDTVSSVSLDGDAFSFVVDADRAHAQARMPISDAHAAYDTKGGTIIAAEGWEKSPLLAWLKASADADVLTHLRTPLMQRELAAGRVMKPKAPGR